jgi:hypothetical protein
MCKFVEFDINKKQMDLEAIKYDETDKIMV